MSQTEGKSLAQKRQATAPLEDLDRQLRSRRSDRQEEAPDGKKFVACIFTSQAKKLEKLRLDNELPSNQSEKFFANHMKTMDDFLGPQFCTLCDDPIQNSVKVRSI